MKNCCAFFLLNCLLMSWQCHLVKGVIQELILHEKVTEDGNMLRFWDHVPDATIYPLYRVTRVFYIGFWNVYSETNYGGSWTAFKTKEATMTCTNRAFSFKSFRYGGGLETDVAAASIYPQAYYGGNETFLTGPAKAGLQGKSILYSGSTPWTLFEGQNFDGPAFCVSRGNDNIVTGYADAPGSLNIARIGSIVRGCSPTLLRRNPVAEDIGVQYVI